MAEARSRYIKTIPLGGYDRVDVDKRLESLYAQVNDLRNELRETKLTLEKLKKGTDAEKAQEQVLAVERAKLTEFQVKNEAMTDRVKRAEEESKLKSKELEELTAQNEQLQAQLADANSELSVLRAGGGAAALGAVFVEAQKSRDLLVSAAQTQADTLREDAKRMAEAILTDADNKAAEVIYEAEKHAAEIEADAMTKSGQMDAASENLKAAMLAEVMKIGAQFGALRQAVENFQSEGMQLIETSEQMIAKTESELKAGGVPVFREPEHVQPNYPDAPELKPVDYTSSAQAAEELEKEKQRNSELDRLQAMAAALTGGQPAAAPAAGAPAAQSGAMDLNALMKQAQALSGGAPAQAAAPAPAPQPAQQAQQQQPSGVSTLADLARQAEALSNKPKQKIDLAELTRQAKALKK